MLDSKKINCCCKYGGAGFFLLFIFLCFIGSFFSKAGKLSENRVPTPFPSRLSLSFPADFEAYYQDNFPKRKSFIKKYNRLRISKFGINDRVILGKNNWYFYDSIKVDSDSDSVADFQGTNLYTPEKLKDVTDFFIGQIKEFEKYGAEVYVVFPPNKMTVYPEYMPDIYNGKQASFTAVDQVTQELQKRGVKVLNLKQYLLENKGDKWLYWRTDTHWNSYGAYLGYKKLMEEISKNPKFKDIKPLEITQISEQSRAVCGDLYNMLGTNEKCTEIDYSMTFNAPLVSKCENIDREDIISCTAPGRKYKMLAIRDSFFASMLPLVANHFSHSMVYGRKYGHYPLVQEVMKNEKPDVVILEYLERQVAKITHDIFKQK